jgi:hypothetical protein
LNRKNTYLFHIMEQSECAICLMPLKYGKPNWKQRTLECGHSFHLRCILRWGRQCPVCRQGKTQDVISVKCYLYTTIHQRCFDFRVARKHTISIVYAFIYELTRIRAKHLQCVTLDSTMNTFDVECSQPDMHDTLQEFYDKQDTFINKFMGFSTLDSIDIHFRVKDQMASKIDNNPFKYGFLDNSPDEFSNSDNEAIFDETFTSDDQNLCVCNIL